MVEPKKELLLPGDFVGAGEEYLPGKGTYLEEDGDIYSANVGILSVNKKEMSVELIPKTRFPHMQEVGMKPIGLVGEETAQMAFIDLIEMGDDRSLIPWRNSAILHISHIKQRYVENIKNELRIGDVVRVKIKDLSPHTVTVDTLDSDCGVILAFCSRCRKPMVREGNIVVCRECGCKETRKLASDYGMFDIMRWHNAGQNPGRQEE